METVNFISQYPWILLTQIWTVPLKGLALWVAARKEKKVWFIVLLVVNTLGLLELFYLLFIEKYHKNLFQKKLSSK